MTNSLRNQFDQREAVDTDTLPWAASPLPGVDRRMLDREGGEVARAAGTVGYELMTALAPRVPVSARD